MNIKINGNLYFSDNYEQIHHLVNDDSYNGLGDAVLSKLSDAVHNSQWYQRTPSNFDLIKNNDFVQGYCGDFIENQNCYLDSANWTLMNKSELTSDIYKFITHRVSVVKNGFHDNFLPNHINLDHILNLIDWHFLLDCICWIF
jgi:hypothetical protein